MTAPAGEAICEALLEAAKAAGAETADAIAISGESLSADVRGGRLEQAERAEGVDVGLRVLIGRRQATVSASDARPATLAALAERAVAMARVAPEDPWCGLADPSQLATSWDVAALDMADPAGPPDPAALEDAARAAEAAALAVQGVSQAEGAGAAWSRRRIHLAASNGFSGGYARTSSSLYVSAIAGEGLGMERDHRAEARRRWASLPSAEEIGREAGERAVARLNPRRAPTGAWPVIYDRRIASGLPGHLLGAINGASVARGGSWAAGLLGERVLPAGMSLVEEPLRAGAAASRPFDAEGLPVASRAFVDDGVLTSWVLDLASARQLGMQSTGNAMRGASSTPSPGTSNIRLTPGAASLDEMLREMGTGLLITSLIGASINATTGDYSRGASGFWIENGEIAYPVNEITVAGNLKRMLAGMIAANDGDETKSAVVPSLLVEGLTVAGG
ncbi:TldD/PmbA family protein [Albimonas sp. CAU 1670]|uniref:TldD/PmbA family protein n=1 Tax=Albimonas sp. CAU 1670 TaxID=3032599 RepID=UPI0023DC7D26|nr:TldD/PmbA family protein [Albimonas sp. CAU 1670]